MTVLANSHIDTYFELLNKLVVNYLQATPYLLFIFYFHLHSINGLSFKEFFQSITN